MTYECTYYHNGPESVTKTLTSQFKMAAAIDAYPDDDGPGTVVAEIFLTEHDDLVVSWHDNGERMNQTVLELLDEAASTLREYKEKPVTSPAEKARQDFLEAMRAQTVDLHLFGRVVPMIQFAALSQYVQKHQHDDYDYAKMQQPDRCLHYPESTCSYPIEDCRQCPVSMGEFPLTTARIE